MSSSAGVIDRNHAATHIEVMIRFACWASALGRVPLPEEIVDHYLVAIATAYRWRNAWCDANGLPIPPARRTNTRPDRFNAPYREQRREQRHDYRNRTRETPSPAATGTPRIERNPS